MSKVAQQRRNSRIIRHRRVRKKVHGTVARPRLAVYRSNKHLTLQLIDDEAGRTIVSASTNEASVRGEGSGGTVAAATRLGQLLAERAKAGADDRDDPRRPRLAGPGRDGTRLASAGADRTVRLWSAADGATWSAVIVSGATACMAADGDSFELFSGRDL